MVEKPGFHPHNTPLVPPVEEPPKPTERSRRLVTRSRFHGFQRQDNNSWDHLWEEVTRVCVCVWQLTDQANELMMRGQAQGGTWEARTRVKCQRLMGVSSVWFHSLSNAPLHPGGWAMARDGPMVNVGSGFGCRQLTIER